MPARAQPYASWVGRFQQSHAGKAALSLLEKKFPPSLEPPQVAFFRPLRAAVMAACYSAAMFDPARDPGHIRRARKSLQVSSIGNQKKAVQHLRGFLARYPDAADATFARTLPELRRNGISFGTNDGRQHRVSEIFDRILEAYSRGLHPTILGMGSGPFLHRHTYGCMVYETPMDDGAHNRRPEPETMLFFDLVQQFRLRSNGIPSRQTGEAMPKDGRPHFQLAAALVRATFRLAPRAESAAEAKRNTSVDKYTELLTDRLKKILKKNPEVGYVDWPALLD